jgi:hydrogenase expression/formation protein HypC
MCIGVPMQVLEIRDYSALCRREGHSEWVDLSLVGEVKLQDWLLVYKGAARELIAQERAQQIDLALQALSAVQNGEAFEHFFADLIEREPELPAHLRSKAE